MSKLKSITLAMFLCVVLVGCAGVWWKYVHEEKQAAQGVVVETNNVSPTITLNGDRVRIEVVDTPEARVRGLSGRAELEEGTGMLFVFPKPDRYVFWMPNMHFAIDIVWLDATMQVVHVKERATPESYPEKFDPGVFASYVLEVPAGYVAQHGVVVGTRAEVHDL